MSVVLKYEHHFSYFCSKTYVILAHTSIHWKGVFNRMEFSRKTKNFRRSQLLLRPQFWSQFLKNSTALSMLLPIRCHPSILWISIWILMEIPVNKAASFANRRNQKYSSWNQQKCWSYNLIENFSLYGKTYCSNWFIHLVDWSIFSLQTFSIDERRGFLGLLTYHW
jgi:hypothetical protein